MCDETHRDSGGSLLGNCGLGSIIYAENDSGWSSLKGTDNSSSVSGHYRFPREFPGELKAFIPRFEAGKIESGNLEALFSCVREVEKLEI
jgi:hypothetical protein